MREFAEPGKVIGYRVAARDGGLGHIDDVILDDDNWSVRYLVVDTKDRWPGKKVLLVPDRVIRASRAE